MLASSDSVHVHLERGRFGDAGRGCVVALCILLVMSGASITAAAEGQSTPATPAAAADAAVPSVADAASAKEKDTVPPEALTKIATEREKDAAFEKTIKSIFADDGIADVRVTFGYDDTKDAREANDPLRAERFMNSLKELGFQEHAASEAAAKALGVRMDAPNLRILTGQTKKGQMLRVALMWSALSKSGTKNIGIGYKDQLLRSTEAMDFTKKACAEAEVMIYVGHSRSGGGPDTYPPETRPAAGGVSATDFSYYKRKRPGMQALGPFLRKREATPKLLSWTGCLSDVHFRDWFAECFAKKSHHTGVILSTRLTSYTPWENAVQGFDEGNMVALAIIHALHEGSDRVGMEEKLRACEMDQLRDFEKPAWRLTMLPGASRQAPAQAQTPASMPGTAGQ